MYDFNYDKNGDDWPTEFSTCVGDEAPIDLKKRFQQQPWPLKLGSEETIFINETNPQNVSISWSYNHTTTGNMRPYYEQFMFNSSFAKSIYKANNWFYAQEFLFRLPSEHTIENTTYDLEF